MIHMKRTIIPRKNTSNVFQCCAIPMFFVNNHEARVPLYDLARFQEEGPGSGLSIAKAVVLECLQEFYAKRGCLLFVSSISLAYLL